MYVNICTAFLVTNMSAQAAKYTAELMPGGEVSSEQLAIIENLATIEGINDAFLVSNLFAVLAFVLSFFIKRVRPPEKEEEDMVKGHYPINRDKLRRRKKAADY